MLFGKKKRLYDAFTQISNYVRDASLDLYGRLFGPEDPVGFVCCTAAVLIYFQIHMDGASIGTDLYLSGIDDERVQRCIADAVNDMLNDYESPAAMDYYHSISESERHARILVDPYNFMIDRRYCALIHAALRYAYDNRAHYRSAAAEDDADHIYYRFFIAQERRAIPLSKSLPALLR